MQSIISDLILNRIYLEPWNSELQRKLILEKPIAKSCQRVFVSFSRIKISHLLRYSVHVTETGWSNSRVEQEWEKGVDWHRKQGDKIKEEYGVSEHFIPCRLNEWDLCLIVKTLSSVTEVNQTSWECHISNSSIIKPLLENFFSKLTPFS